MSCSCDRRDLIWSEDLISTLAEKLRSYGFIQIHRCVLVNSSWVHEVTTQCTVNMSFVHAEARSIRYPELISIS